MIEYKFMENGNTAVYLDGKRIGEIRQINLAQFQYFPNGSKTGGEIFPTRLGCKRSLEGVAD